jgi:hypothetical protein
MHPRLVAPPRRHETAKDSRLELFLRNDLLDTVFAEGPDARSEMRFEHIVMDLGVPSRSRLQ